MSHHGIPGFAWGIRVLLADFPGRRLRLGDGHVTFADARVRAA